MAKRLSFLQAILLIDTVLEEWFRPMQKALDKVRYSRKRFSTLTAEFFILLGCLRQLQGLKIMRVPSPPLTRINIHAQRTWFCINPYKGALVHLCYETLKHKFIF